MKITKSKDAGFVLSLEKDEKSPFDGILGLYPMVNGTHHPISKDMTNPALVEAQKMLEEAVHEQQVADRAKLKSILDDTAKWTRQGSKLLLQLSETEMDWLLQVLNDIRIGCWIKLGSPGYGDPPKIPPGKDAERFFWAMEISGMIQSQILHALLGGEA